MALVLAAFSAVAFGQASVASATTAPVVVEMGLSKTASHVAQTMLGDAGWFEELSFRHKESGRIFVSDWNLMPGGPYLVTCRKAGCFVPRSGSAVVVEKAKVVSSLTEIRDLQKELDDANGIVVKTRADLNLARSDLKITKGEVASFKIQVENLQKQLLVAKSATDRSDPSKRIKELEAKNASLTSANEALKLQIAQLLAEKVSGAAVPSGDGKKADVLPVDAGRAATGQGGSPNDKLPVDAGRAATASEDGWYWTDAEIWWYSWIAILLVCLLFYLLFFHRNDSVKDYLKTRKPSTQRLFIYLRRMVS